MGIYDKAMLPPKTIPGHRGYYPVCSKKEWEDLPDLYKVMQWEPMPDPLNHGQLSGVKSVIFSVTHMMPYGINAEVSVHPSHVQSILFSLHKNPECQLYSVTGVELQSGSRLPATWRQDTTTGAFAILCCNHYVGKQGGYIGFVPECIKQVEDGSYEYQWTSTPGKVFHYELSNPFRDEPYHSEEKASKPFENHPEPPIPDGKKESEEELDTSSVEFYPIAPIGKFEANLSNISYFMDSLDDHLKKVHYELSTPFRDELYRPEEKASEPFENHPEPPIPDGKKESEEELDTSSVEFYPIAPIGKFEANLSNISYFMDSLDDHLKKILYEDQYQSVENTSIYCVYDAQRKSVTVEGTFEFSKSPDRKKEHGAVDCVLTPEEENTLRNTAELQYQMNLGQSCLEYANTLCKLKGLPPLKPAIPPLDEAIRIAEGRSSGPEEPKENRPIER